VPPAQSRGLVRSREELAEHSRIVARHDALVISDEIHASRPAIDVAHVLEELADADPGRVKRILGEKAGNKAPMQNRLRLACPLVRAGLSVGLTVCWFRTSRSHVSRHPGLMSRVIPD
jgi:bifunctional pyridoxal-dependent enzyme with beta-cystathionase and maltose regulon repressor activities